MKFLFILLSLFILTGNVFAQHNLIIINPGQDIVTIIPKQYIYAYPAFLEGSVQLKNGKLIEHKMNYNALFDRIEYINSKEDTIALTNYNCDFLTLGSDRFYYNRVFYKLLKEYDKIRLISRKAFCAGKQRKGK